MFIKDITFENCGRGKENLSVIVNNHKNVIKTNSLINKKIRQSNYWMRKKAKINFKRRLQYAIVKANKKNIMNRFINRKSYYKNIISRRAKKERIIT